MNCNAMERKILLMDAGELSEADVKNVLRHLEECAHCRDYKKSTSDILQAASGAVLEDGPSAGVVERIIAEAEQVPVRSRFIQFPMHTLQLMACAAVLMLIAGGVLLLPGDDGSDRIGEVSAIIAVVSEDEQDTGGGDDLTDLADQLLQLQGFMEYDAIEMQYREVEQTPTTLQLRNTREHLSKECV